VNLPDATGWDVLRRRGVGARPNRETPAVVMSAISPSVARLKEFSPMGVLRKPFPIDALHLIVGRAGEALPAVPVTEVRDGRYRDAGPDRHVLRTVRALCARLRAALRRGKDG
jgi:CheY-like chemotaxis protein